MKERQENDVDGIFFLIIVARTQSISKYNLSLLYLEIRYALLYCTYFKLVIIVIGNTIKIIKWELKWNMLEFIVAIVNKMQNYMPVFMDIKIIGIAVEW